jgi:hypothetical protein
VASGATCSASGHCFVRALLRLDQRVRSVTGLARSVHYGTNASGPRDERVRSVLRKRRHCAIGVSGQFDQRDFGCVKFLTAIFKGVRL